MIPLAGGDPDRAVGLAGLLAILTGVFLLAAGLARLGFVTNLLSKPIRVGYLNGIALVVVVGQIPKLLGFSLESESMALDARSIVVSIAEGAVDPLALAIGLGSLAALASLRVLHSAVSGVLVAVVGSMVATAVLGWSDQVPVVGALPGGAPTPELAGLRWGDARSLVGPALGIALIAFADMGVLSRSLAAERGESVDGDQEMAATGIANSLTGLLGGIPVSASSSRTPVARDAGAQTQLVGVVGAVLVLAFTLWAPNATAYLPSATLAAVVIVAALSLVDVPRALRMLRRDRVEGLLSIAALLGVAFVGVLQGIVVAIALSFIAFVNHARRPYRTELVRVKGLRGYHDVSRHPEGERVPGIAIVRFDAPLFFANAALFGDFVRGAAENGTRGVDTVVLAAEPITNIDATAVDELVELDELLAARGVRLLLAEMKGPVKDRLVRYGLTERFEPDRFFPTVGAAIDHVTDTLRYDFPEAGLGGGAGAIEPPDDPSPDEP